MKQTNKQAIIKNKSPHSKINHHFLCSRKQEEDQEEQKRSDEPRAAALCCAVLHSRQVELLSLSSSSSHRCSARDEQSSSTSSSTGTLLSLPRISSPPCSRILTSLPPLPFSPYRFKHGRVNLLILQAASLSIYLSLPAPTPSPTTLPPLEPFRSGGAALSGSSRAAGLSGVMDDYQPSAVFHYAPGRFTGSLTTRHENQSLLLIPASLSPPSVPSPLLQSLAASISTSPAPPPPKKREEGKKAAIIERGVQNNIEICAWTEGSNCSS